MRKIELEKIEEFINENNATLISEYRTSTDKFLVRCNACGNNFYARMYHRIVCKRCKYLNAFQIKIEKLRNKGLIYLSGEYENSYSPITVRCTNCNKNYTSPLKSLFKSGCSRCSKKEQLNISEITKRTSNLSITLLSRTYLNSHRKLEWGCWVCGNIFKSNWDNIREGHGCPICSRMTGEKNHNWRGGVVPIYSKDFNKSLKEQIRNRDGRICKYPNCQYDDTKEKIKLHVHHIDRNKENSIPLNLISLCPTHHKTVEDKEEWRQYFYAITSDYEYR